MKEAEKTPYPELDKVLENYARKVKEVLKENFVGFYLQGAINLYDGKIGSKLEGTIWAKSNLDPKWINLIDYCWKERQDTEISVKQPANPDLFKESLEFVSYAVDLARKYKVR
jgi:hypothetical protein